MFSLLMSDLTIQACHENTEIYKKFHQEFLRVAFYAQSATIT